MFAAVVRTRDEDIKVTVAVVAPGQKEALAFGVDGNLRKSVGPFKSLNCKHDRRGMNDRTRARKRLAAIARGCEHDRVILAPDGVKLAIRANDAIETLSGAVVVAWQPRMGIDFNRLRPGFSIVGGAGKHHLRIG